MSFVKQSGVLGKERRREILIARRTRGAARRTRLAPVAEAMIELADVRSGQFVLAASADEPSLATAASMRGAGVVSTQAIRFAWPEATFDAVFGFFSVTAHPDTRLVASEVTRVARPGAAIVLATWTGQPWARYETAHRYFFGLPDFDVTAHEVRKSGLSYSLVFARKP